MSAGPAVAAGARTRRRIYSDALDNPTCCGWCSAHSRAPENLHGWSKFPWIIVQIDTDENRLQVRCVLRLVDRLWLLAIMHTSRIQFLFANSRFPIELFDARHFIFEFEYPDRAHHFTDGGPGVIGPEDAAIFVFVIAETYFVTVSVLERFSIPQL